MKIFVVGFINEEGSLKARYVAAKSKAKVRSNMRDFPDLLITEYKPSDPDIFCNGLTEDEKDQFIKAFITEM